ncbi:DHA2 family multidrug resistance protein [Geothermobacter ehrlichii]|uniref:DHA2 family multidrug resistance protein n=1 Tax=Geothermobacter ehrlichii TaxID=213224 RepID=A0A5D3WLM1_9BACT|nr:DHA2 family efflux MFS transporter permease subunit [Geothermobacter ehrlichii]TYP00003.1 DHA2 family multidrug resistance protein [Geothermobacter ehrlichii]
MTQQPQDIAASISVGFRTLLTVVVMVGSFMAILDTTVVDVIVPKMMGPLATDLYGVQWVITAYMTAAAVALLLTHSLGTVLGLKRLFLIGLTVFTLASAFCGMAATLPQMIVSRVVQGAGEAFIMASAQTILFLIYPPEKRGLAMGIYAMGVSFAPSLGPTIGGWITEHLDWRWVFYINLPIGVLNLVAAAFYLPKMPGGSRKLHFNFRSYLLLGGFTVSLLVLLSKGQQLGWGQSTLIGVLGYGAALLLVLYLLSELYSDRPLIDPRIFRDKVYTLSMGFYFLVLGLSIYQVFYLLPLYYENLKQLSTFDTGLHMLVFAIFIAIFSPLAGILSDRLGAQKVLVVSTLTYLLTSYFLLPSLNYFTPATRAALLTIPLGISLGSFFAPLSALALRHLGPYTALGVSLMHYLRFVGGSLGTAIATNTLEKSAAVHYEGIGVMQNVIHLQNRLPELAGRIGADAATAEVKAQLLLTGLQRLYATSYAFQDTFRHGFIFALLGSSFLAAIFWVMRRERS